MQLSDLYRDFATVLGSAPHGESVLAGKLLPANSESVAVVDILSVTCDTSILEKIQAGGFYDQPYNFFHDLKLAFGRLIAQYPQNAPEYDEIAKIFKFAIDLLIREADRLGFTSRHVEKPNTEKRELMDTKEETNHDMDAVMNGPNAHFGPGEGSSHAMFAPDMPHSTIPGSQMSSLGTHGAAPGISGPMAGPEGMTGPGMPGVPNSVMPNPAIPGPMPGSGIPTPEFPTSVTAGLADDEYLYQISQGFQTISTEVQDWNGETYWVTSANGPLFMSVNNKAPIDPRDTAVAGSVHTVKLLPHVARAPESTLGFVSPLNQRFPQPNVPPTDLLSRFVHPNSHATFSPLWLSGQDSYSTFAPSSDSAGAVVGEEYAADVWADKANKEKAPGSGPAPASESGAAEKHPIKEQSASPAEDSQSFRHPSVSSDSNGVTRLSTPADTPLPMDLSGSIQHSDAVDHHNVGSIPSLTGEELEALLRWTPYSFVDDDELEAAKSGNKAEHQLVSRLLLELQNAQQERLSAPGGELDISDHERHIASKSANILARLVQGAKNNEIALQLDTRLPVLMRNYAGSLPAATDPFVHSAPQQFGNSNMPPQSQRLQTIAGLRSRSRASRR